MYTVQAIHSVCSVHKDDQRVCAVLIDLRSIGISKVVLRNEGDHIFSFDLRFFIEIVAARMMVSRLIHSFSTFAGNDFADI